MKHDPLKKAVRRGVEKIRDFQAVREMLGSAEVNQIMKDIEGKCGTALVRGIFGEFCMELKTGDDRIRICENTRIHGKELVYAPVGPDFRLILEQPVNVEKPTDLEDEALYPEIWASFDSLEMMNYQEEDVARMLKKLYPTRFPVMKVSGKAQFYCYSPKIKSTMNGPFKPQDYAFQQDDLDKVVKVAIQRLADTQAGERLLSYESIDQVMNKIEEAGGKAIARSIFGEECAEVQSGEEYIHPCDIKSFREFQKSPTMEMPVPPGYHIWFYKRVEIPWFADLSDDRFQALLMLYVYDPKVMKELNKLDTEEIENFTEQLREEFEKRTKALSIESKRVKISGTVTVYGNIPRYDAPVLNGTSIKRKLGPA